MVALFRRSDDKCAILTCLNVKRVWRLVIWLHNQPGADPWWSTGCDRYSCYALWLCCTQVLGLFKIWTLPWYFGYFGDINTKVSFHVARRIRPSLYAFKNVMDSSRPVEALHRTIFVLFDVAIGVISMKFRHFIFGTELSNIVGPQSYTWVNLGKCH